MTDSNGELRGLRTALENAEGLRDHFEHELSVVKDEKNRLAATLRESERKGEELEGTRDDCIDMVERLDEILTDNKRVMSQDRKKIEVLEQEIRELRTDKDESSATSSNRESEAP